MKAFTPLATLFAISFIIYLSILMIGSYNEDLPIYNKNAEGEVVALKLFELINEDSQIFYSSNLAEKVSLINFFFASCPSTCPQMNNHLNEVVQDFNNTNVEFVSITVDPEHDTPKILKEYINSHSYKNENWHFLTGDKRKIYILARNEFKVASLDISNNFSTDFIHSDKIILLDKKGNIRGYYSGIEEKDIEKLKTHIKKLLKSTS